MNPHIQRIAVIGATSSIATHCTRLWLEHKPAEITLVGRDPRRLERTAADLRARSAATEVVTLASDLVSVDAIQDTVDQITAERPIDLALIAHGFLPEQASCQGDLPKCHQTLEVNGMSPLLYAEAFAQRMETAQHGILAVIGSVAGDRGRRSNYLYGAAKSLLAFHAQGLQHRFAGTPVQVTLIKPGPTDTPMTRGLDRKLPQTAKAEDVAAGIVQGIARGRAVIYVPGKWRWIMWVIRSLPRFVFDKMDL